LLDTNSCIRYLNDPASGVASRLTALSPGDVALCSIVKAELWFGAHRSQKKDRNLRVLKEFFAAFDSLPFDDRAAEIAAEIRAGLVAKGTPIGPHDVLIAAIAMAWDLRLVTHNTNEFGRIPGLDIEDWEG
jgi:tRNA(fMet)-specific endonuclease VapC